MIYHEPQYYETRDVSDIDDTEFIMLYITRHATRQKYLLTVKDLHHMVYFANHRQGWFRHDGEYGIGVYNPSINIILDDLLQFKEIINQDINGNNYLTYNTIHNEPLLYFETIKFNDTFHDTINKSFKFVRDNDDISFLSTVSYVIRKQYYDIQENNIPVILDYVNRINIKQYTIKDVESAVHTLIDNDMLYNDSKEIIPELLCKNN